MSCGMVGDDRLVFYLGLWYPWAINGRGFSFVVGSGARERAAGGRIGAFERDRLGVEGAEFWRLKLKLELAIRGETRRSGWIT
jgi:hypothetical protein